MSIFDEVPIVLRVSFAPHQPAVPRPHRGLDRRRLGRRPRRSRPTLRVPGGQPPASRAIVATNDPVSTADRRIQVCPEASARAGALPGVPAGGSRIT